MNKQKFIEYLRKPVNLDEQNLSELEQLIEEHPYFQSARTLLAKGSKINKTNKFSLHINSAAIYATDRVLLKRYINDELIFLSPLQVHESHEADHERDLGKVLKTNRQATSKQKIQAVPEQNSPSVPPSQTKEPTKPAAREEVSSPSHPSQLDHIIEELYRDMEELKVSRAKFREIENKLEEDEAVDEAVKKATSKATSKKEHKKAEVTREEDPPKKPSESRSARKSASISGADVKKGEHNTTSSEKGSLSPKKTGTGKKNAEIDAPAENSSSDQGDKEDPDVTGKKKPDHESIISDFIKKNPSISPADGKKKIDEDLSGESTILHPDLASEYLAEIYLQQGKKETAKKIYENLIVKFPEKSVYFAEIIKKLN